VNSLNEDVYLSSIHLFALLTYAQHCSTVGFEETRSTDAVVCSQEHNSSERYHLQFKRIYTSQTKHTLKFTLHSQLEKVFF
jgi:hypothetical protein